MADYLELGGTSLDESAVVSCVATGIGCRAGSEAMNHDLEWDC